MSVALLVVTHNAIGEELLRTASEILGRCPLEAATLAIGPDSDPDALVAEGEALIARLDAGAGVLVLTDLFGSTPSNITMRLGERTDTAIVSGVNLPMLLRVLNYPQLRLSALQDKAVSGGRDGVVRVEPPPLVRHTHGG